MSDSPPLSQEETAAAMTSIAGWRADPYEPVACPRCGQEGLSVIDRSARPYSEWYVLCCAKCGIEATLQIPMRPPAP